MTSSASMGESALAAQLCCSDMLPCMVKQAHELNVVQSTQGLMHTGCWHLLDVLCDAHAK